jgi:hypothetical protein
VDACNNHCSRDRSAARTAVQRGPSRGSQYWGFHGGSQYYGNLREGALRGSQYYGDLQGLRYGATGIAVRGDFTGGSQYRDSRGTQYGGLTGIAVRGVAVGRGTAVDGTPCRFRLVSLRAGLAGRPAARPHQAATTPECAVPRFLLGDPHQDPVSSR